MTLKKFFKPTKGKIIALFILMIWSSLYSFADYEPGFEIYNGQLRGTQIAAMLYTGPGWAVFTLVTNRISIEELCRNFPCDFASIHLAPEYIMNKSLGVSLVLLSNLIYWYLITCIFGWIHSLEKKSKPQQQNAQP